MISRLSSDLCPLSRLSRLSLVTMVRLSAMWCVCVPAGMLINTDTRHDWGLSSSPCHGAGAEGAVFQGLVLISQNWQL